MKNIPNYRTVKAGNNPTIYLLLLCVLVENNIPLMSVAYVNDAIWYVRYILLFASFIYVSFKTWPLLIKPPVVFYSIWSIYVFINNTLHGHPFYGSMMQMVLSFFASFAAFVICIYCYRRNEKSTINILILSLYIYISYSFFILGNDIDERLGGGALNSNTIGIRAGLVFFFIILQYIRKRFTLIGVIVLSVLPTYVVILSASRTAFLIFAVLMLFFVLRSSSNKKTILLNLVFAFVAYYGISSIMSNTYIGERLSETSTQIEGSKIETGTFWDYLGDRGFQYYISAPIIEEYPICGIGMGNFMYRVREAYNVYHSEYLIQLCECGLIGFILYFYLYYWVFKKLFFMKRMKAVETNIFTICFLCIIAIMLAGVVTRVSYYSIYSCCLAFFVYEMIKDERLYRLKYK